MEWPAMTVLFCLVLAEATERLHNIYAEPCYIHLMRRWLMCDILGH